MWGSRAYSVVDHASRPRVTLSGLALLPITPMMRQTEGQNENSSTVRRRKVEIGKNNTFSEAVPLDSSVYSLSRSYNSFLLQQTSLGDVFVQPIRISNNWTNVDESGSFSQVDTIQMQ